MLIVRNRNNPVACMWMLARHIQCSSCLSGCATLVAVRWSIVGTSYTIYSKTIVSVAPANSGLSDHIKATGAELIVVLQLKPSSTPSIRLPKEGHRMDETEATHQLRSTSREGYNYLQVYGQAVRS